MIETRFLGFYLKFSTGKDRFVIFFGSEFVWVMSGAAEYVLSKDDVGKRLAFAYIPINFEGKLPLSFLLCKIDLLRYIISSHRTQIDCCKTGQEGESRSVVSEVVKQGIL